MGSFDSAGVVTIDVVTAKKLLDSGYAFLDVRTVEEFKKGHVATEKIFNIPYMFNSRNGRVKNHQFLEEVSAIFKKDDCFIVGCGGGGRSLKAVGELQNNGFKRVKDLGGGYQAWVDSGLPVVIPNSTKDD